MNKLDLEMKLLNGSILFCENIPIHRITLEQMTEFGYSKSQRLLNLLTLKDDDTKKCFEKDVENSTYNLIYYTILDEIFKIQNNKYDFQNKEDIDNLLCSSLPSFLMLIFQSEVTFDVDDGFVIENKNSKSAEDKYFYLNESNFNNFRDLLRYRNCLNDIYEEIDDENPANEMARMLLEKRKKLREKLKKSKQNSNDDESALTIADLISIFAESRKLSLQEIYKNYDIYQFNNQFNRLKIMEDYQVNIQILLAGAKNEDVKLQHWLTKIKKQDEE